jgi:uncharacterized protein involved in exopolysaccharide biosynthesis
MIVPQQVPQDMVRSTVQARVDDRLNMISAQILNRPPLERIIQEFGLYRKEMEEGAIMQDIIDRMRNRDIQVQPVANRGRDQTDAFTVSYVSENPRTAADVAGKLADLFVEEHMKDRSTLAERTTSFIEATTIDLERQLRETERELEQYKLKNAGQLPTQVGTNLQMWTNAQHELDNLLEGMRGDQDQIRRLELEISALVALGQREAGTAGAGASPTAQALDKARATLRDYERRWRPEHPELVRQKQLVADYEKKLADEELHQPVSTPAGSIVGLAIEEQKRLANLRLDLDAAQARLDKRRKDEPRIVASISRYRANVDAAPGLESQFTELMRRYNTIQQTYTEYLRKSQESKLAQSLEEQRIGERFKMLDHARIPERPFEPNRREMVVKGLMFGLGFGLVLVALLEYRDTTLKTDSDVVSSLTLPVLAVIPVILTENDERRRKRARRVYALAGAGLFILIAGVVAVWQFDWLRDLVR